MKINLKKLILNVFFVLVLLTNIVYAEEKFVDAEGKSCVNAEPGSLKYTVLTAINETITINVLENILIGVMFVTFIGYFMPMPTKFWINRAKKKLNVEELTEEQRKAVVWKRDKLRIVLILIFFISLIIDVNL